MYGLKKNEDITFLEGATLLQICVGSNELILNFDENIRLTILSEFSISSDSQPYMRFDSSLVGSPYFFCLLGDSTVEAKATIGGGLKIFFRGGMRVEIFDSNEQHESFWIQKDELIIVV